MAGEITIGTPSTGKISTDGATYIRGRVSLSGKKLSGVTLLLKYTKGGETSFTVSQGTIFPDISTTSIWKMPSGLNATLAQNNFTIVGTNYWQLPIAVQPYGIINLAIAWTGTPNGTTAIVADIIYDTPEGI